MSRNGFEAIAYNAVGRASEVNNFPAYALSHSTGNSGWSVGFMQWDFGQAGRGAAAIELLAGYQALASDERRFTTAEISSLTTRLQTRGQAGNQLSAIELERLNEHLRSDVGRAFVQTLDAQQLDRKWARVGAPLSEIEWLRERSAADPRESIEIMAMASKLFNQNEVRGGRLLDRLAQGPMTSKDVKDWIGADGVQGLSSPATTAILSGRDKALSGAALLGDAAFGQSMVAEIFRAEVVSRNNPSLSAGYSESVGAQLLDAAFRDPDRGRQLLQQIERGAQVFQPVALGGTSEVAKVRLAASGELTVAPSGRDPVTLDARALKPARGANATWIDETIQPSPRGPTLTSTPMGMPVDVADKAGAVQHHLITAPPLLQAPDLRTRSHPSHAAFNEMQHRVAMFESKNGITSGPHSTQLAAAVLQMAVENKVHYQNAYFEKNAETGRVQMVERANPTVAAEDCRRFDLNLAQLSSEPIELSSQRLNETLSHSYAGPMRERTHEKAQQSRDTSTLADPAVVQHLVEHRLVR